MRPWSGLKIIHDFFGTLSRRGLISPKLEWMDFMNNFSPFCRVFVFVLTFTFEVIVDSHVIVRNSGAMLCARYPVSHRGDVLYNCSTSHSQEKDTGTVYPANSGVH